jgi:hypothetical protein
MRKILLATALGLAFTSTLPALDLSFHGGYTSFAMADLNRANASLVGYEAEPYSQPIQSGFVVGADLCSPLPGAPEWLQLGLRYEYLQSNLAELKNDSSGIGNVDFTDQAQEHNFLVGGKATAPFILQGLTAGLGAWAGYAYATLDQHATMNNSPLQSGLFMGSMLVAELETSVGYSLGKRIHLGLTGGWRWADAGYLYDDAHQPLYDSLQIYEMSVKAPVNVDFSGLTAQGSVSYSF